MIAKMRLELDRKKYFLSVRIVRDNLKLPKSGCDVILLCVEYPAFKRETFIHAKYELMKKGD